MRQLLYILLLAGLAPAIAGAAPRQTYSTEAVSDGEMDKFVNDLMSRMTLQEKIGQLNLPSYSDLRSGVVANNDTHNRIRKGLVGGVFNIKGAERVRNLQKLAVEESRLGIPLLMGADVIHGYETIFPIPLGMSCSWDTVAARRSAAVAAAEASATGINWTFNPMVDICRDARWGRIAECNGEDPYLGGVLTKAYVKGYQGSDLSDEKSILACVKHFALYGACESGLDYNYVDMSRVTMFNDYLPPYKAAVDAGVGSLMTSFNVVDRVPATANKWLITDVLRNRWGFDNLVVSDYNGIGEMTTLGIGPKPLCGEMAINAGLDMDMVSEAYLMNLENLVKEGKVSLDKIDNACRRVLEAKYKLGLFKDPYRYCNMKRADKEPFSKEYRKIARELAPETFVLLKNSESLLPLKPQGKIALIGPLANSPKSMAGTWVLSCSTLGRHRTVLDGLRDAVGNKAQILYAQGSNIYLDEKMELGISQGKLARGDNEALLREALETAKNADIIVAALGESADMSGESASRTRLGLPDAQERLLRELVATGKPVVLLLFTGRPLTLTWEEENVPAILNVWFPGSEAGDAIADVLFGKKSPSGKLTTTFPRAVGQCPIYYNHLPSSRPDPEEGIFNIFNQNWVDESVKPLYPFGYGLNYTTFDYGEIRLNSSTLPSGGELTATVKVTNTGERDGTEIVQLYLHDVFASEVRPVKQLKGFSRIDLKKGESKDVTFIITEDDLKFYNGNLEHIFEPGEFELMVGPNSRDVKVVRFEALGIRH